jgi:hypothetical protein
LKGKEIIITTYTYYFMLAKLNYLPVLFCFVICSVSLGLLTNCAGTYQPPSNVSLNKSDTANGIVLYSISMPKSSLGTYYLHIFHLGNRTKERLHISGSGIPDYKEEGMEIHYGAQTLPKGDYKIYGWEIVYNYGGGKQTYFPKANISVPFTIYGGDVNYIGDYFAGTRKITGNGELKISMDFNFTVSNRYREDSKIIGNKYPALNLNKVVDAIPDFAGHNTANSGFYLKGINVP